MKLFTLGTNFFSSLNEELKTAKATITERDTQLETLKKSGADATALQD